MGLLPIFHGGGLGSHRCSRIDLQIFPQCHLDNRFCHCFRGCRWNVRRRVGLAAVACSAWCSCSTVVQNNAPDTRIMPAAAYGSVACPFHVFRPGSSHNFDCRKHDHCAPLVWRGANFRRQESVFIFFFRRVVQDAHAREHGRQVARSCVRVVAGCFQRGAHFEAASRS